MAEFRLTTRAIFDLSEMADFTIQSFSIEQARLYRDGFNNCFEVLAENPQLGRRATELMPNLRRYDHQSHVVFYIPRDTDIFIVRILHQRLDFKQYLTNPAKAGKERLLIVSRSS